MIYIPITYILHVLHANVYIYMFYHKNNVPSRLSPQWLCDNSFTWANDVWLYILLHIIYMTNSSVILLANGGILKRFLEECSFLVVNLKLFLTEWFLMF